MPPLSVVVVPAFGLREFAKYPDYASAPSLHFVGLAVILSMPVLLRKSLGGSPQSIRTSLRSICITLWGFLLGLPAKYSDYSSELSLHFVGLIYAGMRLTTVSIITVTIGIAITMMRIFPASSILEAMAS